MPVTSPSSKLLLVLSTVAEINSTDAIESMLDSAGLAQSALDKQALAVPEKPAQDDPYYGLLSNPSGRWHLVSHGREKAVVLQGSEDFIRRNTNMMASFGGGHITAAHRNVKIESRPLFANTVIVPITEERLITALRLYFYGQIYNIKANRKDIVDEEGDLVEIHVLNVPAMMKEARELAERFYQTAMKDEIAGSIAEAGSSPVHEYSFVSTSGSGDDGDE